MFWGLIMEPGRCYTQTVKKAFHVSMAALDISNSSEEPSQVMCVFDGRNYLLCTLSKSGQIQCPLDLNFEIGSKVSFATNGKAHVHLTGYLNEMDEFGLEGLEEEEDIEELEETELTKKLKRPKLESDGPPEKKTKKDAKNANVNTSKDDSGEEEESDDSDFDIGKQLFQDEVSEEEENEEEEEEDASLSVDTLDEDVSSLSEDEDELEEEEVEEEVKPQKLKQDVKPKENGVAKKTKQQQQAEKQEKNQKQKKDDKKENQTPKPKKQTLKGGVVIEDIKEGTGEAVKTGKLVNVYYEGRFKDNNKVFDATLKGSGFTFKLGKGEVIKGWDTGVLGMKVGGKRRIICPPGAAYGPKGSPPVIPGNATLVFEVELKKIA